MEPAVGPLGSSSGLVDWGRGEERVRWRWRRRARVDVVKGESDDSGILGGCI